MKTRLLKRIRKRYVITKIIELPSHPSQYSLYPEIAKKLGLPFYTLDDTHSMWFTCSKSFDECRAKLCDRIIQDYGEKFRYKKQVSEKVWWNKKNKKI